MKIDICGDLFDEDIIAFVRRLKKPTKGIKLPNGGHIDGGKEYVVQLKQPYCLDTMGKVHSLFLTKEEGESVIWQITDLQKGRLHEFQTNVPKIP